MLRQTLIAPLALLTAAMAACSFPADRKDQIMSSQAHADQLVMAVEQLRGLAPTALGPDNQIGFGTLLFKFLPDRKQLVAAILVSHDPRWNKRGEALATNYRRSTAALSDPAIGGRFDTGGGAWMFDETAGKTYLFSAFPLDAPPQAINAQIERMARVVPAWEIRWLAEVARIAQGKRPAPTQPVTLEHDPYAGQL